LSTGCWLSIGSCTRTLANLFSNVRESFDSLQGGSENLLWPHRGSKVVSLIYLRGHKTLLNKRSAYFLYKHLTAKKSWASLRFPLSTVKTRIRSSCVWISQWQFSWAVETSITTESSTKTRPPQTFRKSNPRIRKCSRISRSEMTGFFWRVG
jgi:hypothetical protein